MSDFLKMQFEQAAEGLKMHFEQAAEWRRAVAVEHPDDKRNLEAAESLERLAKTVDLIDPAILVTFAEEFDDADAAFTNTELLSERIRQIGFSADYENATDFALAFVNGTLHGRVA
jgi:hypothetical protein